MTPDDFVNAIRRNVLESAVEEVLANLRQPPGRRPRQDLIELSRWYHALPDQDRELLRMIVKLAAHHAIFGLFCVLDGSRPVEDFQSDGAFELIFRRDTSGSSLLAPSGVSLHELLNQHTDPP